MWALVNRSFYDEIVNVIDSISSFIGFINIAFVSTFDFSGSSAITGISGLASGGSGFATGGAGLGTGFGLATVFAGFAASVVYFSYGGGNIGVYAYF